MSRNRLMQKTYIVYATAALLSIVLSILSVMNEWVINPDAICYLQSAATLKNGLHAAMNLCGQAKWPFYSILIATVTHLFAVSYLHAAYILNAIFSAMTVVVFLKIVDWLATTSNAAPKPLLLWIAAIIILLPHEFNGVRQYIIRDHGYWAFYLLSLFFLLQYTRGATLSLSLAWSFSLLMATLFRIEGILFLVGLPFIVWFDGRHSLLKRLSHFFQLNVLNILMALVLIAWFCLHPGALHTYKRLEDLQFQLTHGPYFLMQRYYWQGNAMIHYVLGHGTAWIGAYLLFVSLLAWYVMTLVNTLSLVFTFLIGYAWWKKPLKLQPMAYRTLLGYLLINVLITLVFLGENMFLSERYVMALALTALLWAPFGLSCLVQGEGRRRVLVPCVVMVFIVCSSLGSIVHFGYSKKYIYDAGSWLARNVPTDAKIYTNDFQVMYYSGHFGDRIFAASAELIDPGVKVFLAEQGWRKFDYIALRFTKNDAENNFQLRAEVPWRPLKVFQNKRGDKVLIYSTKEIALGGPMTALFTVHKKPSSG